MLVLPRKISFLKFDLQLVQRWWWVFDYRGDIIYEYYKKLTRGATTTNRASSAGDGLGEILGNLPDKSAIPVGPATSLMVVPHGNTVVVSGLWLEEHSGAEEIWIGNNFINCSPCKSTDAEGIRITANSSRHAVYG